MEREILLNTKNMETMISWLTGEEQQRPEFAESFMTTMHLLYMNKGDGEPLSVRRRRRIPAGAAALSLSAIERSVSGETRLSPSSDGEVSGGKEEESRTGGEEHGERDSLELAWAVIDLYGKMADGFDRPRPMSMSMLQAVLYIAYGIFLSERKIRITKEHPQMWRYGPVFARVYSRLQRSDAEDGRGAADRLQKDDPELHRVIVRTILFCVDRGVRAVAEDITAAGSPWEKCRRDHPDKWSTELDDGEIGKWFSESKNGL
jgi:uncharacterized phage-associated protein